MKITKSDYEYINNDLFLIDYLCKILKNQYFYWRNIDEFKAKKFIATVSDLEYCRFEIYKKRSNDVRNRYELENDHKIVQVQMDLSK